MNPTANPQQQTAKPKPGGEIHAAGGRGRPPSCRARLPSHPLPFSAPGAREGESLNWGVPIHDGAAGVGGVGGAGLGGGVAARGVQPGDAAARPRPRAHLLRAAPPPRAPRRLPLRPLPSRARPPRPAPPPPRPPLPRPPAPRAFAATFRLLVLLLFLFFVG